MQAALARNEWRALVQAALARNQCRSELARDAPRGRRSICAPPQKPRHAHHAHDGLSQSPVMSAHSHSVTVNLIGPARHRYPALDMSFKDDHMPKPHGCLLRRGRCSEPGRLYMLTSVTYHRRPLFLNFQFARLVIQFLRRADQEHHCRSLAWVVMPDHVHWLLELKDVTLGTLMQRFKSRTSHALRKAGARMVPVWQAGYHDRALRHDDDVVKVSRYIIANPLSAGLVSRIGDYPHWDAVWL